MSCHFLNKITKFCSVICTTQIPGIEHKLRTMHCPMRPAGSLRLARIDGSVQKQTNCPSVTHITWKIFNCIFFHRQRGPTRCALRVALHPSHSFVFDGSGSLANEWRHCERTRHLDATNYQSLSRNNKAKPWKKVPVKSIAFHMHLARPRGARGGV